MIGGLGVTNRRVCVAKPLSGISKSQTWVFVFCKGQRKKDVSGLSRYYETSILSSGFAFYLDDS